MSAEPFYTFLPDGVSVSSRAACGIKTIYAPLCGATAAGLKSAISPSLSGDIKIDKFHYLTKPASREDLRSPCREFFASIDGKQGPRLFSLAQESSPDSAVVQLGQLWHKLVRTHKSAGLQLTATNFIPAGDETVELMKVEVKNISSKPVSFTATAAASIFGRSLANKHDHEHVTALLHRIQQKPEGVLVSPTMAFNEEGHKEANGVYFVYGCDEKGALPAGMFPTAEAFFGDGGSMYAPQALLRQTEPRQLSEVERNGKEAMGALQFKRQTLKPGQSKSYILAIGFAGDAKKAGQMFNRFNSSAKFEQALSATGAFWRQKISSIGFKTGDEQFNAWMRWVTLQPVLRRIFGCSFLPDHDYGKGGKGWRDIWQDLLSLILIEPQQVRNSLIDNCAGIRIDGSNATIIGTKPGEFIADRNAITRVWMDHGCWPLMTVLLYIHQTGDFDILLQPQAYFRDPQIFRSTEKDLSWSPSQGNILLDKHGQPYQGTILEHFLLQNLVQFFNVGEHNIIRLESADWNDGLDMAFSRGESVAFAAFYGGNLLKLAELIEELGRRKNLQTIRLAKEMLLLLGGNSEDAKQKHDHIFGKYFPSVQPFLSGEQEEVTITGVAADLRQKGNWIFQQVRKQEKITAEIKGARYQWFNGYYDNEGRRVEGLDGKSVRMTLTGQVFPIMSGLADQQETGAAFASVDRFLKDRAFGGYRLNTDFGLRHYLALGRAFSFAYGTKENGAFFSHMNVMYGYALYSRGFAAEGFKVLDSIYRMAVDERAKIYPGIPEYFDPQGRGMYHYLTGSASWLVLTQLTQVFGVRGHWGDLLLAPALVKKQFDTSGIAAVTFQFAGRTITLEYRNPKRLQAGEYGIKDVLMNGKPLSAARLKKSQILVRRPDLQHASTIQVLLDVV